jgi:predicted N-acetyltransferase YhbS
MREEFKRGRGETLASQTSEDSPILDKAKIEQKNREAIDNLVTKTTDNAIKALKTLTQKQKELNSFRLDEEESRKDFEHILWPSDYQLKGDEVQWFLFGDLGVRLETKGNKLIINVMTDRGGDDAKHILNLPPIDAGL